MTKLTVAQLTDLAEVLTANMAKMALGLDLQAAQIKDLVEANTALEQRSTNFAARMTHTLKVYRAEITLLRDRVENGKPRVAAAADRIPRDEWNAALTILQAETGVGYHAATVVRGKALKLREAKAPLFAVPGDAQTDDEDLPF